jgi:thiol:disulfide interchange protein DsbD
MRFSHTAALQFCHAAADPGWQFAADQSRRAADDDFLEPTRPSSSGPHAGSAHHRVNYAIADGYYMYRERFKFTRDRRQIGRTGDTARQSEIRRDLPEGRRNLPQGRRDHAFRSMATAVHAERHRPGLRRQGLVLSAAGCFVRQLTAAGAAARPGAGLPIAECAGAGIPLPDQSPAPAPKPAAVEPRPGCQHGAFLGRAPSELSGIAALLQGGRLLAIVPAFILLGLGLAFTPCVLPMVPILSSIIVGEGRSWGARAASCCRWRIRSAWRSSTRRWAWPPACSAKAWRRRCRTPGCWALRAADRGHGAVDVRRVPAAGAGRAADPKLANASGRQSSGKLAGVFVMGAISA